MSNNAKGRDSRDALIGNVLVEFINRNATPYPTEVGGPAFDLVPVTQQKDIMLNVARLHAQQEYNRITELVAVLQKQAEAIKRRLEITDWVHAAKYDFKVAHGQTYWLVFDERHNCTRLTFHGPTEWATAPPEGYRYLARVRWMGDYTWMEVDDENGA